LNTTGSWAAVLWEVGAGIGHMVLVDGLDEAGYVLIRDPWDSTKYKMTIDDFLNYWTTEGVYWRK
jgi:Papain-like cysteine protease AvrRpt2